LLLFRSRDEEEGSLRKSLTIQKRERKRTKKDYSAVGREGGSTKRLPIPILGRKKKKERSGTCLAALQGEKRAFSRRALCFRKGKKGEKRSRLAVSCQRGGRNTSLSSGELFIDVQKRKGKGSALPLFRGKGKGRREAMVRAVCKL